MERIVWNVFGEFCCIAEKCPDSCCKSWIVDVDEASAEYYRSLEGPLGDRLRQVLRTGDGCAYLELENGRCPMWRQDKLCEIQVQLGHDGLCRVCKEHPRLIMDFGDFCEYGLELSCPEAARLIFLGVTTATETNTGGEEPEYDREFMAILKKSRELLLDFWNGEGYTVPEKLAVTLFYAYDIQQLSGGEIPAPPDAPQYLAKAEQYLSGGRIEPLLEFFREREILTREWRSRLDTPDPGGWKPELQHFAAYLIRRYWLQSVWDLDLICRVKLILAACILVNGLGEDTVETARLFSKEIENDPDNRDAIFDAAYSHPAFTDLNLLGLLHS